MSRSLADSIAAWIARRVEESRCAGAVVGLSGGIDSAVVAVLSQRALGDHVQALIMPCHSHPADEASARLVSSTFGIPVERVDLSAVHDAFLAILPAGSTLAAANLKPRLRMATLYYYANSHDYLVAGTGNKSELMVGYFTKYGDGGVDILPIGGLLKTQVRDVAREIGIPQEIIDRPPSAGLWEGQSDEGELGVSYADLDRSIVAMQRGESLAAPREAFAKLQALYDRSHHKRTPVQIFEPAEHGTSA